VIGRAQASAFLGGEAGVVEPPGSPLEGDTSGLFCFDQVRTTTSLQWKYVNGHRWVSLGPASFVAWPERPQRIARQIRRHAKDKTREILHSYR
jgi:hypothetical protein